MSKDIVVTRPDHDLTVRYLSAWADDFVILAKSKGFGVVDLKGQRAVASELSSVCRKFTPSFFFLNGHGRADAIGGHENELLVTTENCAVLSNSITYALSCQSSSALGPASVTNGARAYIGYREDFIFIWDRNRYTHPTQDQTAAKFLEPASRVPRSLVKGNTVEKAYNNCRDAFRKNIRKLLTSEASSEDVSLVRYLIWDMQNLTVSGDASATI